MKNQYLQTLLITGSVMIGIAAIGQAAPGNNGANPGTSNGGSGIEMTPNPAQTNTNTTGGQNTSKPYHKIGTTSTGTSKSGTMGKGANGAMGATGASIPVNSNSGGPSGIPGTKSSGNSNKQLNTPGN